MLITQVSDVVQGDFDELRVHEIGLELGQIHLFKLDKSMCLTFWNGEIQFGNNGGEMNDRLKQNNCLE